MFEMACITCLWIYGGRYAPVYSPTKGTIERAEPVPDLFDNRRTLANLMPLGDVTMSQQRCVGMKMSDGSGDYCILEPGTANECNIGQQGDPGSFTIACRDDKIVLVSKQTLTEHERDLKKGGKLPQAVHHTAGGNSKILGELDVRGCSALNASEMHTAASNVLNVLHQRRAKGSRTRGLQSDDMYNLWHLRPDLAERVNRLTFPCFHLPEHSSPGWEFLHQLQISGSSHPIVSVMCMHALSYHENFGRDD